MMYFEFKVQLSENGGNIRQARKWCEKNFGKQDVISLTYKRKRGTSTVYVGHVYDKENNRWHHKVQGTKNESPRNFHFKNGHDAMAFKLRWI